MTAPNRLLIRNFGTALRVGVTNTDVITASNQRVIYTAMTLECWAKPAALSATGHILSMSGTGGHSGEILYTTNNKVQASIFDGGTQTATSNSSLVNGVWYHLVMTAQNSGSIILYVNGVAQTATGSVATMQSLTSSVVFYMGNRPPGGGSQSFNGVLDVCRVFNGALTAAQVSTLYYSGVKPVGVTLDGEWLFDEGSGSTALDTSGNGNNGVITGATYVSDVVMKARTTS